MFEGFAERARGVVVLAEEEARRLGHNYVGTEHLLLGLLREQEGVAVRAMEALGITPDRIRRWVIRNVGSREAGAGNRRPLTPRARRALKLASKEACHLGHECVGAEHILIGLARENEGTAAQALYRLGTDTDELRREVSRVLGDDRGAAVGLGGARLSPTRAFLSLGSNLGRRLWYLRAAVGALGQGPLLEVCGTSKVYETTPVEVGEEQPDYLNCVVEVLYGATAIELLRFCQGIEAALGRVRGVSGEKAPRVIDIDVLLFGEQGIDGPYLDVPHPGVLRAFNLKGLADLAPDVYIPGHGAVGELLAGVDLSGVRELAEDL
jgi:2-amino-4-hydroxy-6-hydroxymethyldihydropteridine diphosphokinase